MGKKLILLFLLFSFSLAAEIVEFGRISYLNGEVRISRNTDNYAPQEASRIYFGDTIILGNNGAVRIKTNFNSILSLKDKQECLITAPSRYQISYGGKAYVKALAPAQYLIGINGIPQEIFSSEFVLSNEELINITPENKKQYTWGPLTDTSELYDTSPQPIQLNEPLWRTAVFPGWGHLHIDNPVKGWPMLFISAYLLYNAVNTNPANWHSGEMQEIMNNKKTQFQQLYFVYWSWALLDVISESDNYNKKIMAEKTK